MTIRENIKKSCILLSMVFVLFSFVSVSAFWGAAEEAVTEQVDSVADEVKKDVKTTKEIFTEKEEMFKKKKEDLMKKKEDFMKQKEELMKDKKVEETARMLGL